SGCSTSTSRSSPARRRLSAITSAGKRRAGRRSFATPAPRRTRMSEKTIPHPSVFFDKKRLERIKGYRVHEARTPERPVGVVTPSQTIGPFFAPALIRPGDDELAPHAQGTRIVVSGRVTDETGKPVRKALIELWQANKWGKYEHPDDITDAPLDPGFKGWGRMLTGEDGRYRFRSIKPGAYPNPGYDDWYRPPHVHYSIFAAG